MSPKKRNASQSPVSSKSKKSIISGDLNSPQISKLKIGLILECGPQGADKKVCEILLRKLKPEIKCVSVTLSNKPNLVSQCGESASQLLNTENCDRVLVIWDLYPTWRENKKPCLKEDRESIFQSLKSSRVDLAKVHLICIQEELEAWLLADGRAISKVLSRPTRPVTIKDERHPDRVQSPKTKLTCVYQTHIHRKYSDLVDAEKIALQILDFSKIKRSESFRRFADAVGQALDALTSQLGQSEASLSLMVQTFQPDLFFTAAQQQRLSELMELWRTARDREQTLTPQEQAELDALVNAELQATQQRLNANTQRPSRNS